MNFTITGAAPQQSSSPSFQITGLPSSQPSSSPDTLASTSPAQQINQNLQSGKINPADAVIQDVGEAASQTNQALTAPWSPIGWVTDAVGGAAKVLGTGLDAVDNYIAPKIGAALRTAVGAPTADKVGQAVADNPITKAVVTEANDPGISGDVNAVSQIANLAATATGASALAEGAGALSESAKPVAETLSQNSDAAAAAKAPTEIPKVVGKITNASPEEIPAATRALSTIDTSNVKTFSDLSNQLDAKIKTNTSNVDTELDKSPQVYREQTLNKTTPVKGGEPVVSNPVSDALDQLKTFYQKTNDMENAARIQGLQNDYKTDGLTLKQINNIAREHGAELNGYNANGELASGLSRQAAENTRQGVKATVRSLNPNDTTGATDKNTADLIKTKNLVDDMNSKVQTLQNKLRTYGPLQQVGRYAGKAVDLFSGGLVKGFLKSVMGIGNDNGSTMNAMDLQKSLQGNLKLLDRLNALPAKQAVSEIGKIIDPLNNPQQPPQSPSKPK